MDNNLNPTPTPSIVQSAGAPASSDSSSKLPLIAIIVSIVSLLLGLSGLAVGLVASGQSNNLRHENDLLKTYLEVDTKTLEAYASGEYEDEGEIIIDDSEEDVEDTNTNDTEE